MKNLIAFILFGLLSGPMFSIDHNDPPAKQKTLKVYAESGLKLRAAGYWLSIEESKAICSEVSFQICQCLERVLRKAAMI